MTRPLMLVVILVATYVGMQIYTEGIDRVFGGIFASLEIEDEDAQPVPGGSAAPAPRGPVTEVVRDRVNADFAEAARRRGYDED